MNTSRQSWFHSKESDPSENPSRPNPTPAEILRNNDPVGEKADPGQAKIDEVRKAYEKALRSSSRRLDYGVDVSPLDRTEETSKIDRLLTVLEWGMVPIGVASLITLLARHTSSNWLILAGVAGMTAIGLLTGLLIQKVVDRSRQRTELRRLKLKSATEGTPSSLNVQDLSQLMTSRREAIIDSLGGET